ncbi:MAG: hypothetical protein CL424_14425 [Acidimicrobiaceae bacterium]|nr:hypothetical protein [Acidimicrobiaceae bacterium]
MGVGKSLVGVGRLLRAGRPLRWRVEDDVDRVEAGVEELLEALDAEPEFCIAARRSDEHLYVVGPDSLDSYGVAAVCAGRWSGSERIWCRVGGPKDLRQGDVGSCQIGHGFTIAPSTTGSHR